MIVINLFCWLTLVKIHLFHINGTPLINLLPLLAAEGKGKLATGSAFKEFRLPSGKSGKEANRGCLPSSLREPKALELLELI